MESFLTARMLGILAAAVSVYYGTLVFYRLFFHPLARFPGPRLAAISRWYEAYYDVILAGQYTSKIAELHEIYGPILRISPYELHVIDPAFYDTLYRMDGRWDKYSWTCDAFGAKNSTIFCSDHNAHKARRNAIAPFFSKPNVIARQDILHRNIEKLSHRISTLAGTSFNLGAAIGAFARDTANEFILGKVYNELDLEDFGIKLSTTSQGMGAFWRTTKHIRWFGPAMKAIPIDWAMKTADEGTKAFLRYLQQSEQDTKDILTATTSSSPEDIDNNGKGIQNTMVYAIFHSNLPPADKTLQRMFEEVGTVTAAGFDTISNTNEIAAISTKSSGPITLRELEQLPYLTATIREGLRLSPAIASRAARISDKDLFYDKWCIPAGTPVGMTTLLIHTNEKLYPDPMRFDPDRWMRATALGKSNAKFAPFSQGTRVCIGMHFAWAELYLLLTALVQGFNFTIEGATASDFELESDGFAIGTKAGCNLNVHVIPYEG